MTRTYTQPAKDNTFPYFMIEMKSEAAGETLHVAEYQAADSDSHSVNALLWLFKEADLFDSHSMKNKIVFSINMFHRKIIFYIHWYSADERRFYMSFLKTYSPMVPEKIRACNNTVKNIIDFGVGARKTMIGNSLKALFPFPEHWKQAQPASTAPLTTSTSSAEDTGLTKNPRQM